MERLIISGVNETMVLRWEASRRLAADGWIERTP
jgi:hypothetical protein